MKIMKKIGTLSLVCFLAATMTLSAQKRIKGNGNLTTTERNVGSYDGVFVGGSFDVELVAGAEGKISIKIEENLLPYLVTEVKNGELVLNWKKGHTVKSTTKSKIIVPVKSINEVALGGSGNVYSSMTLNSSKLKVSLAGSGNVTLDVDTSTLSSNLAGSGNIKLSGTADAVACSLAGSGNIRASGLNASNVSSSISGSGDVHVGTVNALKVRVSGSGNVTYKGNPTTDVKISGSGDVRKNE